MLLIGNGKFEIWKLKSSRLSQSELLACLHTVGNTRGVQSALVVKGSAKLTVPTDLQEQIQIKSTSFALHRIFDFKLRGIRLTEIILKVWVIYGRYVIDNLILRKMSKNQNCYLHIKKCWSYTGTLAYIWGEKKTSKEKKEEIWLSPMTKAPTPTEMSKGQSDNSNNATKKFD